MTDDTKPHQSVTLVGKLILTLSLILGLAFMTMTAAYLLSDRAQGDPQLINQAGALRMATYRIALYSTQPERQTELQAHADALDHAWHHDIFYAMHYRQDETSDQFRTALHQWQLFRDDILAGELPPSDVEPRAQAVVNAISNFVAMAEANAQHKIVMLRLILVIALFATIILAGLILYWLKTRFEEPLFALTQQARRIAQGDFTARTYFERDDELGVLAKTLNKMSDTVSSMYGDLESRVDKQTYQLQQGHKTLQLLYDISRDINEKSLGYHDFNQIIERLRRLLHIDDLELCLLTEQGKRPYLQFQPEGEGHKSCVSHNCAECIKPDNMIAVEDNRYIYRFPLSREQKHYGVLIARCEPGMRLEDWKQQLLRSVAEQLSIALNLKSEEENMRRLALMKERTVIARELHDSLAQALSYLKIQVVRLSKATQANNPELIDDVTNELKEGLNSAYRQLRELLTTFRLKVDGGGLQNALLTTVQQLEDRSDMRIKLHYSVADIPLAPHEEVHLLQIIREASQNAVNHSQGSELHIRLEQEADTIHLAIEDNGVGIPDDPEKLNHYGLAIMQERSKHLGGILHIKPLETAGTGVYFSFSPEYLNQPEEQTPPPAA